MNRRFMLSKGGSLLSASNFLFIAGMSSLISACSDNNNTPKSSDSPDNPDDPDDPDDPGDLGNPVDSDLAGKTPEEKPDLGESVSTANTLVSISRSNATLDTVTLDFSGSTSSTVMLSGFGAGNINLTPVLYQFFDDDTLDFVVNSNSAGANSEGKVFVYWDAERYAFDPNSTNYRLVVTGSGANDQLGYHDPSFLKISGKEDFDMVIRSQWGDKEITSRNIADTGVIYVLWDFTTYVNTIKDIHTDVSDSASAFYADSGLLSIYGHSYADNIGIQPAILLDILGDSKNDMVIASGAVDKTFVGSADNNYGAVYVVWDVADYYSATTHKRIDLGVTDSANESYATNGLLTIYGEYKKDQFASALPTFANISNDDKIDMVATSYWVDKDGDSVVKDLYGGIYIIWNIGDYYSKSSHKSIDLDNPASAEHGVLRIYGANQSDALGNENNNVLYNANMDDNTKYSIDIDEDGVVDVAFQSLRYAYVLFGDADNVLNFTIDLFDLDSVIGSGDGFFSVDSESGHITKIDTSIASTQDEVEALATGYRFNDRVLINQDIPNALDVVKSEYDAVAYSLSEESWDIL